jgi:hypothetical protein
MNNNWHKKEKPILGLTGLGGGVDGLAVVGASSPYTDAVWFKNAASNATAAALKVLELYNSSLTETAWEVPAGVTSVSVAVIGGGGGGYNMSNPSGQGAFSSGGGELVWRNGISVTPGQTLYVKSGVTKNLNARGAYSNQWGKSADIGKYISNTSLNETAYSDAAITDYSRAAWIRTWSGGAHKWLVFAEGGRAAGQGSGGNDAGYRMSQATYGSLGSEGTDWGHAAGGTGGEYAGGGYTQDPRGSGGAAGYTGDGGNGATGGGSGGNGSGGGSGGGAKSTSSSDFTKGRGGATYMWGEGTSGSGGTYPSGNGGDGSASGGNVGSPPAGLGQGGDGYRDGWVNVNAKEPLFEGWARIAYSKDGTTRSFPSTNVGYPG